MPRLSKLITTDEELLLFFKETSEQLYFDLKRIKNSLLNSKVKGKKNIFAVICAKINCEEPSRS